MKNIKESIKVNIKKRSYINRSFSIELAPENVNMGIWNYLHECIAYHVASRDWCIIISRL